MHLQSLAFFLNIKNKQYFLSLLVTYLCADDFVQPSLLPILVNINNETLKISLDEANTRQKPILYGFSIVGEDKSNKFNEK